VIGCRTWQTAGELPPAWDALADTRFQGREFLAHCEAWNPCSQRYYGAFEGDRLAACAIVYTLGLDLLTFTRATMPVATQIVGVPCSVSSPGMFGDVHAVGQLIRELPGHERGLLLTLNLPSGTPIPTGMTTGHTLPTVRVERSFESWDEYLGSLRSDYRRRISIIKNRSSELHLDFVDCSTYSDLHHELYLEVLANSSSRLERLAPGFFAHLGRPFGLMTLRRRDRLEGWALILDDPDEFTFVFGGIDYRNNPENATYLRLLLAVLRRGIESGAGCIELGQTAENPKLRLGGVLHPLRMAATHSNGVLRAALKGLGGMLEYRASFPEHHVFRGMP